MSHSSRASSYPWQLTNTKHNSSNASPVVSGLTPSPQVAALQLTAPPPHPPFFLELIVPLLIDLFYNPHQQDLLLQPKQRLNCRNSGDAAFYSPAYETKGEICLFPTAETFPEAEYTDDGL